VADSHGCDNNITWLTRTGTKKARPGYKNPHYSWLQEPASAPLTWRSLFWCCTLRTSTLTRCVCYHFPLAFKDYTPVLVRRCHLRTSAHTSSTSVRSIQFFTGPRWSHESPVFPRKTGLGERTEVPTAPSTRMSPEGGAILPLPS